MTGTNDATCTHCQGNGAEPRGITPRPDEFVGGYMICSRCGGTGKEPQLDRSMLSVLMSDPATRPDDKDAEIARLKAENALLRNEAWQDRDWEGPYGVGDAAEKEAMAIVKRYHGKWDLIWAVGYALRRLYALVQNSGADAAMRADAERWRALIASPRIRIMGWAGFDEDGRAKADADYQHFVMEIWSQYSVQDNDIGAKILTEYADAIRAREASLRSEKTE